MTLASTLAKESTSAIHMDWYRDRGFARRVVANRRSALTARQLLNSLSSGAPSSFLFCRFDAGPK
jgi:hypothetical protein